MYKIEPHLHTCHVSPCGHMTAEQLTEAYAAAGYSGIAVTDHYSRYVFQKNGVDITDPSVDAVDRFLTGFRLMQEEGAKRGLTIYKGAELRFDECDNDYLLYGWDDELLADPDKIFRMGIAGFSKLAREAGALLIQAHPYRHGCTPAIACYLDGIEVINANPRHDSRNELAKAYAEEFGLIATAGSDCHRPPDVGLAGICTEKLPADSKELAQLIRSGEYQIFGE